MRQVSGLGNQLFQYAAGQYYARRLGGLMEMVIDPPANAASFGFPRPFLLSHFCVERPLRPLGALDRALFANKRGLKQAAGLLRRALGVEEFVEPLERRYTLIEDLPIGDGVRTLYLTGYWQTAALVDALGDSLRAEFRLKEPATGRNLEVLKEIRQSSTPVSLHIRRGDLNLAAVGVTPLALDYYLRAIAIVREKWADAKFFVFSDDIEFARANLPADVGAVFVDHNDAYSSHEDLRLMSACRHHIIANSTFSWWGAWMNRHSDKLVIGPREWLGKTGTYYPGLFPADWIILD